MQGPEPHPWRSTACWKVGGETSVKNFTVHKSFFFVDFAGYENGCILATMSSQKLRISGSEAFFEIKILVLVPDPGNGLGPQKMKSLTPKNLKVKKGKNGCMK